MRAQFVRHGDSKRGLELGYTNKKLIAKGLEEDLESHGIVFQQYPEYRPETNGIYFETESVHYVKHYTVKFLKSLKVEAEVEMTGLDYWHKDATFAIIFDDES